MVPTSGPGGLLQSYLLVVGGGDGRGGTTVGVGAAPVATVTVPWPPYLPLGPSNAVTMTLYEPAFVNVCGTAAFERTGAGPSPKSHSKVAALIGADADAANETGWPPRSWMALKSRPGRSP